MKEYRINRLIFRQAIEAGIGVALNPVVTYRSRMDEHTAEKLRELGHTADRALVGTTAKEECGCPMNKIVPPGQTGVNVPGFANFASTYDAFLTGAVVYLFSEIPPKFFRVVVDA